MSREPTTNSGNDGRPRAREIFESVCELTGPERERALTDACAGNAALRAEVESLLNADNAAGSFIESPTLNHLTDAAPISEAPGSMIGPYKLLQLIGEGGFGMVFMAEQTHPIKRRVALKIIKLGMDTRQIIARFEAERQALALMDHPNIARVLDAGATATGRPYFVMELVRGDPIGVYCNRERLPTRARLELFEQVCRAVQHAHHKGIIHRDIKPSNVLVTVSDGKPIPKVIDFGIAKATNSELTQKTLFTEFRQLIGTPEYMSPEQAERSGVDIDTRSDIYSLGVLLYELLTGTTPLDSTRLRSAAWGELQRMIREEEPQSPSARLSTLGNVLPDVAKQRQVDPAKLRQDLRGDLDWIVMKCLEKDRTRRYPTADGLGEDVRRHLDNQPITAGPPSARYALRKFARRNRRLLISAGAAAAAIILGLIATSTTAAWALRERTLAQRQLERSRRLLAFTVTPGLSADQLAQLRGEWSEEIVAIRAQRAPESPERIRQEALFAAWLWNSGNRAQAEPELDTVLDRARRLLPVTDPARFSVINAEIQRRVVRGESQTSLADLYNDLVASMSGVFGGDSAPTLELKLEQACVLANAGDGAKAVPLLREYLDQRERGGGIATATSAQRAAVAVEIFMSRPPKGTTDELVGRLARLYYTDVLGAFGTGNDGFYNAARTYGRWLWERERYTEAEPVYTQLLASLRIKPATDPVAVLMSTERLGYCKLKNGNAADADPLLRESLKRTVEYNGEQHYFTHVKRGSLGECLTALKKFDEAESILLASRDGLQRTSHEPERTKDLKLAARRLVELYTAWNKPEEAAKWRAE